MLAAADPLHAKLDALRTELADLAFTLERRQRHDAADLARAVSARLGEFSEELRGDVRPAPVWPSHQ